MAEGFLRALAGDRFEVASAGTEATRVHLLVVLLVAVAVLYAVFGQLEDAITILVVILAVAGIEIANETHAKRTIASLRTLSAPAATVVRDGEPTDVPATDIVLRVTWCSSSPATGCQPTCGSSRAWRSGWTSRA
jgi:cation transport ATPase